MDTTEQARRTMIASGQPARDEQEATERWTTAEMQRDFEPLAFQAPFVVVRRRSDQALGTLEFTHAPRVYFNWHPHEEGSSR